MPWSEGTQGIGRLLRRVEVRAALGAGLAVAVLLGLQALGLYLFVANEYLEEAQRDLHEQAALFAHGPIVADAARDDGLSRTLAAEGLAVRLERPDGTVLQSLGPWPDADPITAPARPWARRLAGLVLGAPTHLFERVARSDGTVVALALPLAHTRRELAEIRTRLLALLAVSFAGGVGFVLLAVGRSLAPLREGTRRLEAIGADGLGSRLPDRGTGDLVDRHAAALNDALDRIADAFARLRAFSADVAHELRTPVHRIRSAAELALTDAADAATARDALHTVATSAEDLTRVIDALLLLARLEEGGQPLERSALSLAGWLEPLVELYRPLCAERGIALDAALEPAGLAGDRALLDRLVCNLFDNAIRHGGGGGRIRVTGGSAPGGVELRIADAGPGVPPADREHIFDRFRRLDPARGGPGSGIGLALARAIARAHGGSLRALDSPLGGACFALWLPGPEASTPGG